MVDVASIAKKALDAVAAKVDGVVHQITLTHTDSNPVYDAATGVVTAGTPVTATGRAIDEAGSSVNIMKSVFPAYVIVGGERVLFLEGLNRTPVNGDTISGATIRTGKITAVQDILAADQAYRVIVI
jgi:hypothetical protein